MVLSLDRWVGKVAVVTGASAGIGAAIAEKLAQKGMKVVGLARRENRLKEIAKKLSDAKGELIPMKADMSKEEDILNAFKYIKEHVGPVHILINNAGVIAPTTLTEGETEKWKNVFNLNVIGLCIATREAINDMKANKIDGHIIHINGITGHKVVNFPGLNVYPASKFAVTALAETLRLELNSLKSKIKISSISPGGTDTEIGPAAMRETARYKEIVENKEILESEDIADAVVYVLSTPPHVQVQELTVRSVIEDWRM